MAEASTDVARDAAGVYVRRATWRDKEQVLNLLEELQAATPGVQLAPRPYIGRIFDQHINSPLYVLLVAEIDEGGGGKPRLAGMLSMALRSTLLHAGVSALVDEVVVAREFRRRGVALALLEQAVRAARAAGCREVEISTTYGNEAALALYREAGFEEQGIWLERRF